MSDTSLRDGWTHDPDYRRCYQTEDDIETILGLLALDKASGLVDVGCGNGGFAVAAARRYPACQVHAFDALDSAIAECRTAAGELANLHADVAWAHSIPLPDSCADRVLFRSVLHHIADPRPVYAELSRLLRPGELLVLQAPCNYWEASFGAVLRELMMLTDDSHPRFYYRPAEIVAGLQAAGFAAEESQCWPYSFPFLEEDQARFIQQRHAAERLRLQPIDDGKWTMEGSWVRVVAKRLNGQGASSAGERHQENP